MQVCRRCPRLIDNWSTFEKLVMGDKKVWQQIAQRISYQPEIQNQRSQFLGCQIRQFNSSPLKQQLNEQSEEDNYQESKQQYPKQDDAAVNMILQDEAMASQRDACTTLQQIDYWAENNFFDLSTRTCVKWLAYDSEVDYIINGPQNVDALNMMKSHDVKLHISDPGDYHPGIRKRVVSLVGRGHNLMAAFSKLLPALHKHQHSSCEPIQKIIFSNSQLKSKEQTMIFQAVFPRTVMQHLVGKESQRKARIQQFCDVVIYQQSQQTYLPGVNVAHIDIYGKPVNVVKTLITMLGYLSGFFSEEVGLEYRKFINQSVYKHTEQAWLGQMNRGIPHNSNFKNGDYELEFTVASEMVPYIIGKDGETLQQILKKSRAQVSIEEQGADDTHYNVIINGQHMQVMRAQALIVIQLLKANQISKEEQQEFIMQLTEEQQQAQQ